MRFLLTGLLLVAMGHAAEFEYRLLATNRTSTMEKEMNAAAADGFRYSSFIGGQTSFGGHEVVVVMVKQAEGGGAVKYRLVAAGSSASLTKKLQAAGDDGFEFKAATEFHPEAGPREALVVMEQSGDAAKRKYSYQTLATVRTSTMQKELAEAGRNGFRLLGVAMAQSGLGVGEVVAILGKEVQ